MPTAGFYWFGLISKNRMMWGSNPRNVLCRHAILAKESSNLPVALPYPTLPYPALPYLTLPYPTPPYSTLPCSTLPHPILRYRTLLKHTLR